MFQLNAGYRYLQHTTCFCSCQGNDIAERPEGFRHSIVPLMPFSFLFFGLWVFIFMHCIALLTPTLDLLKSQCVSYSDQRLSHLCIHSRLCLYDLYYLFIYSSGGHSVATHTRVGFLARWCGALQRALRATGYSPSFLIVTPYARTYYHLPHYAWLCPFIFHSFSFFCSHTPSTTQRGSWLKHSFHLHV